MALPIGRQNIARPDSRATLVVCYFLSQEMRASLLRLQYVVLVNPTHLERSGGAPSPRQAENEAVRMARREGSFPLFPTMAIVLLVAGGV